MDDRPRAPSSHGGDPLQSAAVGVGASAGARDGDQPAMIQARSSQLTERLMAMRGSKGEVGTSVASNKAADGNDRTQWIELLDAVSGNKYWQNTTTGKTTWQSPESTISVARKNTDGDDMTQGMKHASELTDAEKSSEAERENAQRAEEDGDANNSWSGTTL